MKTVVARFFDALFITRPIILIPVWGYFLLGYYRACLALHPEALTPFSLFQRSFPMLTSLPASAILALIMLSCSVAGAYILNQLADIKTDRENQGLPLLAKANVPLRLATIENIALSALPLAYALFQTRTLALFFVFAFALNILYNLRPFYFTGRPFLDFLANALGFGFVAFGIGWLSANQGVPGNWPFLFWQAAPYFFFMVAGSINSTLPDIEGDRKTGKITTMVYLGTRRANGISTAAIVLALLIALKNHDVIAGLTALVSLPFFGRYLMTNAPKDGLRTFQGCGGFLMVMTVFVYPWFFFYGLITYLATRVYFRVRHGVDYPSPGMPDQP